MGRILIIDDEPEVRAVLFKLLSRQDYICREAQNAEEAREILAKEDIDLALVDIHLPGESGIDFVRYAKDTSPSTVTIMVTGVDDHRSVSEAMEAGIYAYILKPFNNDQILVLVRNALRQRRIEIENRRYREQLEEMLARRIKSLQESEAKLKAITSSAYDPIILADDTGTICFWNQAARKFFGYTEREAIGMAFQRLFSSKKAIEFCKACVRKCLKDENDSATGKTLESAGVTKEGHEFPIELSLSLVMLKGRPHTLAIVRDITQRKEAENSLKKAETDYRRTIEAANEGVSISKNGVRIFVNQKFSEMFAYKKEELLGKKNTLIVHPDEIERVAEITTRRIRGEDAPERYEFKGLRKDGKTIYVEVSATCASYGGEPATVAFFRDVTERKKMQRQMEMERRRLHSIFDSITEFIYVVDPMNHEILFVNKALETVLGKNPVGGLCYREFQGLNHPCEFCTNSKILENKGEPYYWNFYNPLLGKHFKIVDRIIEWPDGRDVRFEFAMDVSDLKKAEKDLKRAHEKATMLLKAITSILIALDEEDRIVEWNSHAEEIFNISVEQAIGAKLVELGISWNLTLVSEAIRSCKSTGKEIRLDDVSLNIDGKEERLLGITVSPIIGDNADIKGTMIRAADITEQRVLERQLAQAQKLEAVGQLAAGIAHEINTPTQFIGDNLSFLTEAFEDILRLLKKHEELVNRFGQDDENDAVIKDLRNIEKEIDLEFLKEEIPKALEQSVEGVTRVTKIVRAMKEFSHPGKAEKSLVDINHAIENTATVAKNEWKYVADLEMDLDPQLPLVPCLPGDLNQVILNLLINSAHAIENVVPSGSANKGKIRISTRKVDGWVEIGISDTGSGIPESVRDKIFDPFFTTKEVGKGTGQGLFIAHNIIVDKHGGMISFQTKEGEGTTFIVRLPLNGDCKMN